MSDSTGLRRDRLLAAAAAVIALAAWGAWIFSKPLDYDEVEHAHAIWLVGSGLTPYVDFFEVHLPFFWYVMSAFSRFLPESPFVLILYRLIAAAGHLVGLALLAAFLRRTVRSGWAPPVLAVCIVTMSPTVLSYLSEFRRDGWAFAWVMAGVMGLADADHRRRAWRQAFFMFTCAVGVATSARLVPLVGLLAAAEAGGEFARGRRRALTAIAAMAAGGGCGAVLAWLFLRNAGVDLALMKTYVVDYHVALNAFFGDDFAFARRLITRDLPFSLLVAAGLLSWASLLRRGDHRWSRFHVAFAVWLALQPVMVKPDYVQFVAPWYLIGAAFVPFLSRVAAGAKRGGIVATGLFATLVAVSAVLGFRAAVSADVLRFQLQAIRWMNLATPESAVVAAVPPYHPIFRRDVFFAWVHSFGRGGKGTEAVMQAFPRHRDAFGFAAYARELAERPPDLIFMVRGELVGYLPGQAAALKAHLRRNIGRYEAVPIGGHVAMLRNGDRSGDGGRAGPFDRGSGNRVQGRARPE